MALAIGRGLGISLASDLLWERRAGCRQEATTLSIAFARMLAHVATEQMTGSECREVS